MMTPVEDMSLLTSFMFTGCDVLPKSFLPFPRTIGQVSSRSRSMRFIAVPLRSHQGVGTVTWAMFE